MEYIGIDIFSGAGGLSLGAEWAVTIQQGEILLHYDMIAVKSHAEPQRLLSRKGGDFEPQRS